MEPELCRGSSYRSDLRTLKAGDVDSPSLNDVKVWFYNWGKIVESKRTVDLYQEYDAAYLCQVQFSIGQEERFIF